MTMDVAAAGTAVRRGSAFNDPRLRAIFYQVVLLLVVVAVGWFLVSNLIHNREVRGIQTGYGFLSREAGFAIAESPISYSPSDPYARAFLVGLMNTLKVSVLGIILATLLGLVIGVSKLSSNWLLAKIATAYVDVVRNIPLTVQLLLWAGLIRVSAPPPRQALHPVPGVFVSNRGIQVPSLEDNPIFLWMAVAALVALVLGWGIARWAKQRQATTGQQFHSIWVGIGLFIGLPLIVWLGGGAPAAFEVPELKGFNFQGGWTLTPEFAAMLIGLTVYTAAFIAEIVRGGILAVSHGQTEAARALGLHSGITLRRIVLPQALRTIIPPLTSQYLNVTKNSSLAVVIGYPELVSIGNTIGNQTGQVVEAISIFMAVYLLISLSISIGMNIYNRRMSLRER
ncbi:amino acid ABC transporter permease [Inquilinus limosus]|uniref:Amino acid ABC transporter permease n=1 Tax=Inquilinus limosus TaxID=171674 RepID=A0A211Z3N0_9PROT|nr:amino acid ABC transporter permease [Inquilinus limosus]OWJ59879.1 amino acid ABC transporter permease [Inquilinus limosus]